MLTTDQMNHMCDVQTIYESLTSRDRYWMHYGLLPMRIKAQMEELNITYDDLMRYDELVRNQRGC